MPRCQFRFDGTQQYSIGLPHQVSPVGFPCAVCKPVYTIPSDNTTCDSETTVCVAGYTSVHIQLAPPVSAYYPLRDSDRALPREVWHTPDASGREFQLPNTSHSCVMCHVSCVSHPRHSRGLHDRSPQLLGVVQPAPCDMFPLTTKRTHQTYLCISSEATIIPTVIQESLINYEQVVA